MKDESPPDSKAIQERFAALGKGLLTVPRAEVAKLEKKWQTRKSPKRKKA
jgi:hypothetical protein